jgi:phage terminase small subunit
MPPTKANTLSPRQARFVSEYLKDLNATQAAIRAGFSKKTAGTQASRLLRNVHISQAISEGTEARSGQAKVESETVLRELAMIAFSDLGQILDFTGDVPQLLPANAIPEPARRALSSVKVKRYLEGKGEHAKEVEVTEFKLWSKIDALEKLAKHLGLFKDVQEIKINGETTHRVIFYIPENGRDNKPIPGSNGDPAAAGAPK